MSNLVEGVGLNDLNYVLRDSNGKMCPYYRTWGNMLKRCYNKCYHETHISYIGCSVCKEWLLFSNFRKWMIKQDWKDKQLDKDILVIGNKIYGPETCCFVYSHINKIISGKSPNNEFMQGVTIYKDRFRAQVSFNKINYSLGTFFLEKDAHIAYCNKKSDIIFNEAKN